MKAIILARISSKEQFDGHSLDAQMRNLEQYAERKELDVIKKLSIIESSTKKQRPEFDEMITFIKRQKTKIALIVDTVDRLQRSFKETPIFNDLMQRDVLELHFVKEGNVLCKDANSTQKLMWNMGVVMAQSYTDQLSDNIRGSVNFKLRNGGWCGQAPLGYLNIVDSKNGKASVAVDLKKARLVKKLFSEYSKGTYSLKLLSENAKKWGLTSRKEVKLGAQYLQTILQNPFYYGVMRVKGQLYQHNYEPLISKQLFDKCQEVKKKRGYNPSKINTKYPFLFRSLITCQASGRQVTCDIKKGKYFYLICRNPKDLSHKIWIKELIILKQVEAALKKIHISDADFDEIKKYTQKRAELNRLQSKQNIMKLHEERTEIEQQIDKLTDLLVKEQIPQDIYNRKYTQLQQRNSDITADLRAQLLNGKDFEEALLSMLLLCNKGLVVFKSSKTTLKRHLLKTVFSNLQMNGEKLRYTMNSPLSECMDAEGETKWWREQDFPVNFLTHCN